MKLFVEREININVGCDFKITWNVKKIVLIEKSDIISSSYYHLRSQHWESLLVMFVLQFTGILHFNF